jgi:hypothetical protein
VFRIILLSCIGVIGLLASLTGAVRADQGVSIDTGSISVDAKLSPGGRYRLPTVTVRNIGDETSEYEVAITHLNGAAGTGAPADWFDLDPAKFVLAPQEARTINIHITLPRGAQPGPYNALIEAHPVIAGEGVQVSAAAASRVSFEVRPSSLWAAWMLQLRRSFADHSLWSYSITLAVLFLTIAYLFRRFMRLRISFERRR